VTALTIRLHLSDSVAIAQQNLESGIIVGLQCGGSDGYSGITANPALGAASVTGQISSGADRYRGSSLRRG
jgi:altronate dehydratase